MTTKRRIDANRRNSKRSPGPETPNGKADVSLNSLKHGLLAATHCLQPYEDPEALDRMGEEMLLTLNPVGELECQLVRRIVSLWWRILRVEKIEAGMITWQFHQIRAEL